MSKKPKPAETARVMWHFDDGTVMPQPLMDLALSCIRQWALIERLPIETREDVRARQSATESLRRVAEAAIRADVGMFKATEGGRKGGKRGSRSKRQAILAEADRYRTVNSAAIQSIARKVQATPRTVRDTLTRAGRYKPREQKKSGK